MDTNVARARISFVTHYLFRVPFLSPAALYRIPWTCGHRQIFFWKPAWLRYWALGRAIFSCGLPKSRATRPTFVPSACSGGAGEASAAESEDAPPVCGRKSANLVIRAICEAIRDASNGTMASRRSGPEGLAGRTFQQMAVNSARPKSVPFSCNAIALNTGTVDGARIAIRGCRRRPVARNSCPMPTSLRRNTLLNARRNGYEEQLWWPSGLRDMQAQQPKIATHER